MIAGDNVRALIPSFLRILETLGQSFHGLVNRSVKVSQGQLKVGTVLPQHCRYDAETHGQDHVENFLECKRQVTLECLPPWCP